MRNDTFFLWGPELFRDFGPVESVFPLNTLFITINLYNSNENNMPTNLFFFNTCNLL
jgi:hypothetical protein